jgi:hypothetical protein
MADEIDYKQQWHNFLNRGPIYFPEELLKPDIALLVSPDGDKIIVVGDNNGAQCEYNEKEQVVYVSFCKGGFGNSFTCPACGQHYMITPEPRERDADIVFIQHNIEFYNCACGVVFVFYDRYEFVSLPFDIEELAPLYFSGLSQTADLLVRYLLSSDGQFLVEEICEVTQHTPEDVRLTDKPDFKFEGWTTQPSFITGGFRVHNVRPWRRRVYKLGLDTFREEIYRASGQYFDPVIRKVGYIGDWYTNRRMLEALELLNENQSPTATQTQEHITKGPKGGDQRAEVIKRLWADTDVLKRYALKVDELYPVWTMIKRMAHPCKSKETQDEWLTLMLDRPEIIDLMARYHKLTLDVLCRAVDDSLKRVNREPYPLTFFHAALELEVNINGETLSIVDAYLKYEEKPLAPTSFKPRYKEGKTLLSQSE